MEDTIDDTLNPALAVPSLHFDELASGDRFYIGTIDFEREDTIAFARTYDPQPFHLDDEAAAANPIFGRLSASGWHTAVMAQILVSRFMRGAGLVGLAGSGVDRIDWIRPVFPPETLSVNIVVDTARPSRSRPERGILTSTTIISNAFGEVVARVRITGVFLREGPHPS